MGTEIDREEFGERDYLHFAERLAECLGTLGQLMEQPGFGAGPATVGAELELFLVDRAGRPLPRSQAVRAAAADPRVTVELNQFNLELNASPAPLAGRPFSVLGGELHLLLDHVAAAARQHGGRPALIGILPTLTRADLGPGMMSDAPRYRALNNGLRRLRPEPFRIRIAGDDPLELASEDVGLEGANSSFQVHLRVGPADFTRTYNAIQLATAPVLAVSGNSPTFLGHRLWHETRIAVFKQSVDDRGADGPRRRLARTALGTGWLRGGALELFTQSVRLHQPLLPALSQPPPETAGQSPLPGGAGGQAPSLDELRLHQGTVWRWNRGIYDPAQGGHLRIEMRALPAGPTVIDMVANAALLIGLSLWLPLERHRVGPLLVLPGQASAARRCPGGTSKNRSGTARSAGGGPSCGRPDGIWARWDGEPGSRSRRPPRCSCWPAAAWPASCRPARPARPQRPSRRPPGTPAAGSPAAGSPHSPSAAASSTRAPAPGPARTSCRSVVHIGDSTSEGLISPDYLPVPRQRIGAQYARVGVTTFIPEISGARSIVETYHGEPNAYTVARQLIGQGYRGCWVLALGTNDTADVAVGSTVGLAARITQMMSLIGRQPVMWVNVRSLLAGGPYSETDMLAWNQALTRACARYPDMRVYDWAAAARDSWYTTDGIHFTSAGYAARARLIARALATAFPDQGSGNDTGPPPRCLIR